MEKIRFGIVGYGAIGPIHAHVLTQIGGVELIAICSPSEAHRHRVADEFPQVALFQDYDEMLVQSDLDAVSICTPSGLHADQGGAAARAGVHVLVEKPIDISLERADALIAACREAGLRL
ncbi:MAG: Gfo/Idh/MocA family protein, partial [Candidatus Bipolaricaulia bacterium]